MKASDALSDRSVRGRGAQVEVWEKADRGFVQAAGERGEVGGAGGGQLMDGKKPSPRGLSSE